MRIWITGAGGMVGRALIDAFAEETLLPSYHRSDEPRVDLEDRSALEQFADNHRPDLVLHAAAMTDVDRCEQDPDASYRANAEATAHLSEACLERGMALLYFSTDFVFDGRLGRPYREDDPTKPINHYGRAKLAGEWAVRRVDRHWIVRSQWIYDAEQGFPHRILAAARERPILKVVDDQFGCPTLAADLAEAVRRLAQDTRFGTYHITNGGFCSKAELAREALHGMGLDAARVEGCDSDEYPAPAARPGFAPLDNHRWRVEGYPPLRPWKDALRDTIRPHSA